MCCNITIDTATNVYCGTACCDSGFLSPPDTTTSKTRINKCEIQSYEPVDTGTSFDIHFTMKNGIVIVWSFTNNIDRDESLSKIDEEMNAKEM